MAAFNTQEKARKLKEEATKGSLQLTETSDSKAGVSDVQDGSDTQKDIPVSGMVLPYLLSSMSEVCLLACAHCLLVQSCSLIDHSMSNQLVK